MLRLITDFDGPIMDVSERYYQVYQYCLDTVRQSGQPVRQLSKAEFWSLKRSQVPERRIGQISGLDEAQSRDFAKIRRETVHTLPYLKYDTPVPGAIATLERLQSLNIELAVMTMRRVRELEDAFNRYDLARFFANDRRYCLANDYVKTSDVEDKPLLMERAIVELTPAETWMVGDTEADIAAARSQGIPVIAVLSGIRDRDRLTHYEPDYIVDNLVSAVDLMLKNSAALSIH